MRSKHTAAWSDTSLISAPPASGSTISSSCHRPRSPPISTPLSRIDHCTAPLTTALRVAAASLSSSIGIMRTIPLPSASSPPASSFHPTNSAHSLSPAPSALVLLACDTLRRLFTSPSTIAEQPDSATSRRISICAANLASSWHPCHATKFNTDLSARRRQTRKTRSPSFVAAPARLSALQRLYLPTTSPLASLNLRSL